MFIKLTFGSRLKKFGNHRIRGSDLKFSNTFSVVTQTKEPHHLLFGGVASFRHDTEPFRVIFTVLRAGLMFPALNVF